MSEHTKGPWEFTASGVEDFYWISQDKPGKRTVEIARVFTNTLSIEEAHANASLIAAAPELLSILKRIVDRATAPMSDGDITLEDVAEAREIIAKAEGK